MGRPEKPIDPSGRPVAVFASELRRLRARAGNPTYREMARSALFSPSVLSSAASGHRLPTLQVTLTYVAACGGDVEEWRRRWLEVSGRGNGGTAADRPAQQAVPATGQALARSAGLAGHAAPLLPDPARLPPRPAQLPPRPRGFVGRADELRRLRAASATPLVICGPVGVGKTGLALHFAHDIAAEMVDGQLYADLHPPASAVPCAQSVLDGFLHALGVPADQMPPTADQRVGLYRSLVAERRLLVLLDNVSDERQVRPLLADMRHSVTIMVSRDALLGLRDVGRIRLDVLRRADSVAMITAALADSGDGARTEVHSAACDKLAELCGDLPLALDIAARKLGARPGMSLRRVTSRLADTGAVLDWLRIGDLSVRDSLRSAYARLGPPATALLHRLARQPAGAPVVWADSSGAVSAALAEDAHARRRVAGSRLAGHELAGDDLEAAELVEELAVVGMLRRGDGSGTYQLDPLARSFVLGLSQAAPAPNRPAAGSQAGSRPGCRSSAGYPRRNDARLRQWRRRFTAAANQRTQQMFGS